MHAYNRTEVWPGPHNFNENAGRVQPDSLAEYSWNPLRADERWRSVPFFGNRSSRTHRRTPRTLVRNVAHRAPTSSPHTPPQLLHTCSHITLRTRSEESHPKGPPTSNARTRDLSNLGTRSSSKHTRPGTQSAAPQQVDWKSATVPFYPRTGRRNDARSTCRAGLTRGYTPTAAAAGIIAVMQRWLRVAMLVVDPHQREPHVVFVCGGASNVDFPSLQLF